MIGIFERVFGCSHKKTTFPITRTGRSATDGPKAAYIVCLECGREFDYDWQAMKIGGTARPPLFTVRSLTAENTATR